MASLVPDITGFLETLNGLQTGSNWGIAANAMSLANGQQLGQAANAFQVQGIGDQYQTGIDAAYQNAIGQWDQVSGAGPNPGLDILRQQAENQRGLTSTLEQQIAARGAQQAGVPGQMGDSAIAANNTQFDQARTLAEQDDEINRLKQLDAAASGGGGGGGRGGGGGGSGWEDWGGGGGGGRRGGGGRGGSGGGGDELTEGDITNMAQLEEPNVDYRALANSRKGSFGDKGRRPKGVLVEEHGKKIHRAGPGKDQTPGVTGGAYGKGAQDLLFGQAGGAKGHVAPDLSNIDQVLNRQLAWVDKTRRGKDNKLGTKDDRSVGYSKKALRSLAGDLKGRSEKAQSNLRNKQVAWNKLDIAWADDETGVGGVENIYGPDDPIVHRPQDIADVERAKANNPGPTRKQKEKQQANFLAAVAKNEQNHNQQIMAEKRPTPQQIAQYAQGLREQKQQGPTAAQVRQYKNAVAMNQLAGRRGGSPAHQGRVDERRANLLRAQAFNQAQAAKGSTRRRRGYAGKRPGPG